MSTRTTAVHAATPGSNRFQPAMLATASTGSRPALVPTSQSRG